MQRRDPWSLQLRRHSIENREYGEHAAPKRRVKNYHVPLVRSLAHKHDGTKEEAGTCRLAFPENPKRGQDKRERGELQQGKEARERREREREVIAQSGPREILARSLVPFPPACAHARHYLAERDKSLVPHVIKSFSRSRGSKGKERRTFERAGRETRERHTTDLDSAALCASVDDKGRLGGREGRGG